MITFEKSTLIRFYCNFSHYFPFPLFENELPFSNSFRALSQKYEKLHLGIENLRRNATAYAQPI